MPSPPVQTRVADLYKLPIGERITTLRFLRNVLYLDVKYPGLRKRRRR